MNESGQMGGKTLQLQDSRSDASSNKIATSYEVFEHLKYSQFKWNVFKCKIEKNFRLSMKMKIILTVVLNFMLKWPYVDILSYIIYIIKTNKFYLWFCTL